MKACGLEERLSVDLRPPLNDRVRVGRASTRKVKKIRRTANTYVAEDVEIFQDNVHQSFAVAADGRSLVRGFTENPGSQEVDHIYR